MFGNLSSGVSSESKCLIFYWKDQIEELFTLAIWIKENDDTHILLSILLMTFNY